MLLHAAFQILTDFVDREHPFDHFDVMRSQNKDDWEEILRLYAWWTVERPAREDPFAGPTIKFTKAKLKSAGEADDRHEDEDQEMLVRLILVRKMLWT